MRSNKRSSHITIHAPSISNLSEDNLPQRAGSSTLSLGPQGVYYLSDTNMSPMKLRRRVEEPTQSDKTLVLNLEDLISLSFGPLESNVVNFKAMQLVLHHLARQMRLLEQEVEIRFTEEADKLAALKEKYLPDYEYGVSDKERKTDKRRTSGGESDELSSSDDEAHGRKGKKHKKGKSSKKGEKGHSSQDSSTDEKHGGSKRKYKSKRGATDKSRKDRGDESSENEDKVKDGTSKLGSSEGGEKGSKRDLKDRHGKKDSKRGERKEDQSKLGESDKSSTFDVKHDSKTKHKGREGGKHGEADETSLKDDSKVGGEKGRIEKSKQGGADGLPTSEDAKQEHEKKDKKLGKLKKELFLDHVDRSSSDEIYGFERKYERKVKPKEIGLTVSEIQRQEGKGPTDTIIVVEKGPTTRDSRARLGDIEIITRSEFELLKSEVRKIIARKGKGIQPTLPEDEQLKSDLTKGTATLPGTMQAMLVNDRVRATENALTKMAALLTQLALAGAFPPEMTGIVAELEEEQLELARILAEVEKPSATESTISAKPSMIKKSALKSVVSSRGVSTPRYPGTGGADALSTRSVMSAMSKPANALVTRSELDEAIMHMRNELVKNLEAITAKGTASAERARNLAHSIEEQLEVALDVDKRVEILKSLTTDYAEQLSGFDSGLTTQLQSFYDQMAQMHEEFKEALDNFELSERSENSAVSELKCCHKIMDKLLTDIQVKQYSLIYLQQQLTDDMKNLVDMVETLRDEKADQEEVADGLNDKADLYRLGRLLREDAFEASYGDLTRRLKMCYEKFDKQNAAWKTALQDIYDIREQKAENDEYLELRDHTTKSLDEIQEELFRLEIMLGEPKAAILTRPLKGAKQDDTSVEPPDVPPQEVHLSQPPPPEILKLDDYPIVEEEPCTRERRVYDAAESTIIDDTIKRKHLCKRWVGGSHTRLTEYTTREKAQPMRLHTIPTKHYTSYGIDGRLYMMEEELQPCLECNQLPKDECDVAGTPSLVEIGGGDQGRTY